MKGSRKKEFFAYFKDETFTEGIHMFSKKANRAYYSWCNKFNILHGSSVKVIIKLFDNAVKLIMLYGSIIIIVSSYYHTIVLPFYSYAFYKKCFYLLEGNVSLIATLVNG